MKYKILQTDSYKLKLNKDLIFDAIITDPPYNISKKNNFKTMNRAGLEFGEWDHGFNLTDWIKIYYPHLKEGGSILIFTSWQVVSHIYEKLGDLGAEVKDFIRWVKANPMPRNINSRYVSDTEYCIWAIKPRKKKIQGLKSWTFNKGDAPYRRPEYNTSTVAGREKVGHPTQKSLDLMVQLIKTHTNENDLIIDPFMGSGTTGVAALLNNRKFIGIEKELEFFKMAEKRLLEVDK